MRTATASYEGQERGRGDRFLDEVKEGLQRTQQCPRLCPMYEGNYRRYLLNRFPFGLMNRIDPERLFLMAVAHLRGQLPRPHRRFSTQTECRPSRERHATRPDPRMVSGGCRHPTRRRPHRSRPTAEPGGPTDQRSAGAEAHPSVAQRGSGGAGPITTD
jgi:hypothetical protein